MKKLLILSLLLSIAIVSQANANVVDFDDAYANSIVGQQFNNSQSFSDEGLTFTSYGTFLYVWGNNSPNSNGTNSLIFAGFNTGDYLAITQTGGGDLPQILVPHVKLGFRHFLFLNSGTPLALEDGNSKNCVA